MNATASGKLKDLVCNYHYTSGDSQPTCSGQGFMKDPATCYPGAYYAKGRRGGYYTA